MVDALIYHGRKQQGVCVKCGRTPPLPLITMCAPCRDAMRAYQQRRQTVRIPDPQLPRRVITPLPQDNLLGCCGRWWPITTLPFRCPACGRTFGMIEEHL